MLHLLPTIVASPTRSYSQDASAIAACGSSAPTSSSVVKLASPSTHPAAVSEALLLSGFCFVQLWPSSNLSKHLQCLRTSVLAVTTDDNFGEVIHKYKCMASCDKREI